MANAEGLGFSSSVCKEVWSFFEKLRPEENQDLLSRRKKSKRDPQRE